MELTGQVLSRPTAACGHRLESLYRMVGIMVRCSRKGTRGADRLGAGLRKRRKDMVWR